jgi:hypothetical protein
MNVCLHYPERTNPLFSAVAHQADVTVTSEKEGSQADPGRAGSDREVAATAGTGGARMLTKRGSTGEWMSISFSSVLIIAGISVFVPVVLGLLPPAAGAGCGA